MAQPNLEKFARRGLALKLQAAIGTPVDPTAAANGIRFYDGQSGTEFDTLEENRDKPYFGGNEFSTFNHRAFIEGAIHLYPPVSPGTAGAPGTPDCHPLLLIGGMALTLDDVADTSRYNPISENIPAATADFWHAGTIRTITDARANISSLSLEIGNRARAQLRVQGDYTGVNEEALPNVVVPETFGPVIEAQNSSARIIQYPNGVAGAALPVRAKTLSVDFGTQLATKEYTEHKETGIDGRQPTFTFRIARTAKSDFDPWAVRKAGTYIVATLRAKNADNRYVQLGVRGLIRDINEVDIDGDYGWELTGTCVPSATGGDEFYVLFGVAT